MATRRVVVAALTAGTLYGCSFSPVTPTTRSVLSVDEMPATGWTSIGPVFSRGFAGKLNAFVYERRDPRVMLVAGGWGNTPRESPSQAGIFRTSDGGERWIAADDGLTNPDGTISSAVNGLWLDQSHPTIVLAATEFGGTFRSTNGGITWHNVDRSESTQFAQMGTTLYLASRRGVLVSRNDGASWKVSLACASGATSVVTTAGAIFAGDAEGNVFRLHDDRWSRVGHPGTGAVHDIAIDPFDTRIVYANVDDRNAWNEVLYGSVDGGREWTRIYCHCAVGAQAIAFSQVVPDRLYLGDDGGNGTIRYFAADGNAHPKISSGGRTSGADVRYIFVTRKNARAESCYVVSDQGLFVDVDCSAGRAVYLSNGIANFLTYDVTLSDGGRDLVVPLQDYNAVSASDGGAFRNVRRASEGGESFLDPYNPKRCYLAHPDAGLFVSTDACATFTRMYDRGIESLAFLSEGGIVMYAVTHDDVGIAHVAKSSDGGHSWTPEFPQFDRPYQIIVSPNDDRRLLVAGGDPNRENYVYLSTDGGRHWQRARGLLQTKEAIEQYFPAHRFFAAFDQTQTRTVLLADHDPRTNDVIVYRSGDDGATFVRVSRLKEPPTQRPWPNLRLPPEEREAPAQRYYAERFYGNRLAFNPKPASGCRDDVVLTTRFGAFESFDTGSSWRRIDTTAIAHHFIGATWLDGAVYLASFGEGAIERPASRCTI